MYYYYSFFSIGLWVMTWRGLEPPLELTVLLSEVSIWSFLKTPMRLKMTGTSMMTAMLHSLTTVLCEKMSFTDLTLAKIAPDCTHV